MVVDVLKQNENGLVIIFNKLKYICPLSKRAFFLTKFKNK